MSIMKDLFRLLVLFIIIILFGCINEKHAGLNSTSLSQNISNNQISNVNTGNANITENSTHNVSYTNLSQNVTQQIWVPEMNSTFQWQLDGKLDTTIDAEVYDIDLFYNSAEDIGKLHSKGKRVVCYINVGAWEDWREDKNEFPPEVIGSDYGGWKGEKWLDIRRIDLLEPIMIKRLELAKKKGCDGIEPDNIEGYESETGFAITKQDQLAYNIWLANETHKRWMSIGLKNDPDQANDLQTYFDWALIEDCYAGQWCQKMNVFSMCGKAVFQVEYTDEGITLEDFCPESKKNKHVGILKHRGLGAWLERCS